MPKVKLIYIVNDITENVKRVLFSFLFGDVYNTVFWAKTAPRRQILRNRGCFETVCVVLWKTLQRK